MRSGYKITEMGVIPEEWEVLPLGDLFDFQNGVNADKKSYGSGVRFVNVLEVITHPIIDESRIPGRVKLPVDIADMFSVRKGDVVFNRTSETQEELGLSSVYVGSERVVFGGFVIRGRPRGQHFAPLFAAGALRCPLVRRQVIALGQGAVRANIGQGSLCSVLALVPPLPEQQAIAEALSDADALIESQERLLAKKRLIKQGAMQELLSGRRRLPGFSGEWEVRRLGDVACIKTGSKNNEDKVHDGQYPFYVRSESVERIDSFSHECEAILVPGDGRIGSIFHYVDGRFDVHQRVYAITRFTADVSAKFVHAYMTTQFGPWAMQNTAKATVDSLRLPTFMTFVMRMPPSSEEQFAIAAILSDMDAEIEALERKLAKSRQIKEGMMQELLTGRIRLV